MKVRTQIQLEPQDHETLQRWARQHGVSMSGALRLLIRRHLMEGEATSRRAAFLSVAGAVQSSLADEGRVAEDHDHFVYGDPSSP